MDQSHIRNFSIIAHIDHGKSTLADRFLEQAGLLEKRKMREQTLDRMDLERERGITIKMQPVRLFYRWGSVGYQLNLIDTPGHVDFSYEVSRALQAVEGVILLVDATQGIQAQTLSVLQLAQELKLEIIPAVNKIDAREARVQETVAELAALLKIAPEKIILISARSGTGVEDLLQAVIERVPPPGGSLLEPRALVFDFSYLPHRGVVVFVRVNDGQLQKGQRLEFISSGESFQVLECGIFTPDFQVVERLMAGEIGYLVTGLKSGEHGRVGDTLRSWGSGILPVPGYREPTAVVWAALYPESQEDFPFLKQGLERLRLSDSALSFEEETSLVLGRGFRAGFLGLLHLEIVTERLRREHNLSLIVAAPTTSYQLKNRKTGRETTIRSPLDFPTETKDYEIQEQFARAEIITPLEYLSVIVRLAQDHEAMVIETANFGERRLRLLLDLPLRELMRGFFEALKSASAGYASLSYQLIDARPADVVRLDILINGDLVGALTRVVGRRRLIEEARTLVERLAELIPRQLIVVKIQAQALGRIVAARAISALRKNVTDYLYGGDITRKMKLREKQKKGKKRMQTLGKARIPASVFLQLIKGGDYKGESSRR